MGKVIGKNHEQLNSIKKTTGAEFETDPKSNRDGALYIRGSIEGQKRAIRKIKEIVVSHHIVSILQDTFFNKQKEKRRAEPK